jgi:hypothetical protein
LFETHIDDLSDDGLLIGSSDEATGTTGIVATLLWKWNVTSALIPIMHENLKEIVSNIKDRLDKRRSIT